MKNIQQLHTYATLGIIQESDETIVSFAAWERRAMDRNKAFHNNAGHQIQRFQNIQIQQHYLGRAIRLRTIACAATTLLQQSSEESRQFLVLHWVRSWWRAWLWTGICLAILSLISCQSQFHSSTSHTLSLCSISSAST